jgi:hypothetical protein
VHKCGYVPMFSEHFMHIFLVRKENMLLKWINGNIKVEEVFFFKLEDVSNLENSLNK